MKFVDEITLFVKGGNGGRGCVSFRHDYLNPKAGPDGGDGGDGGSIYLQGDEQINSFFPLRGKKIWVAANGENGQKQLKNGKNAKNIYIHLPLGTVIKKNNEKEIFFHSTKNQSSLILGEILLPDQTLLIAKGGKGGKGNHAFANSINRAPNYAQSGLSGEEFNLQLELKILADVGLLGLPNVGKSTLVNSLTNAKLKTANFPFTTLNPQLGVLIGEKQKITIADLPGIIEGAAQGKGLGLQFLRHVMRCSLIVYFLDATNNDPEKALLILEKELKNSGIKINSESEKIIIWNKIDLLSPNKQEKFAEKIRNRFSQEKHFFLSALKKINLDSFVKEIIQLIEEKNKNINFFQIPIHKIYDFTISLDLQIIFLKPHHWKLTGSTIANLMQKYELEQELDRELKKLPLDKYFQEKGVKSNDTIFIGEREFTWKSEK